MKKLKFAVIGCGGIGQEHIKILQKLKNTEISAGAETNPEKQKEIRDKYNIKVYTDYKELLENEELDACIIASPHYTHAEIGLECIKRGIHILVEKPVDIDYKRAESFVREAKINGVKLAVVSQYRFTDGFKELKRIVETGILGKVFLVDVILKWFRGEEYYADSKWRGKLSSEGGGTLITQALHFLDQILWIFGDVDSVMGEMGTFRHNAEVEDTIAAVARLKNGAICNIISSCAVYPGFMERMEVHGSKGSVIIERDSIIFKDFESEKEKLQTPGKELSIIKTVNNPVNNDIDLAREIEIMEFCSSVMDDKPVQVTGEDGLKALKFALAIYSAVRNNNRLKMDDFLP
ncbi:Gfo/Idh/MocA family protein [candidate division KSB1 bacterium]